MKITGTGQISVGCMLTHDDEEKSTFPRVGASDCTEETKSEEKALSWASKRGNDFAPPPSGILPSQCR
jgi:hypothetical protein